jgi:ribosomal protein S18 acetylase RimI-like enzyme
MPDAGLRIRTATHGDVAALAAMNAQLIRDEGHRNAMSLSELGERMTEWLASDYSAAIAELDARPVGYVLWRHDTDHVYLRQLFVDPAFRRRKVGSGLLGDLRARLEGRASRLRIDVLIENESGRAFWQAAGFKDYCMTMEMPLEPRPELFA